MDMKQAGFHEEVANSLKFISGTQCVKGRQRYIMPNFRISQWTEEMNPYFIDQVWYHYRWDRRPGISERFVALGAKSTRALYKYKRPGA